jgi:hypothetical protein
MNPRLEETMSSNAGAMPSQQERTATNLRQDQNAGQPAGNLAFRYGAIGIPAVAAALRYTASTKNPAYAPVVHRPDPRLAELAI